MQPRSQDLWVEQSKMAPQVAAILDFPTQSLKSHIKNAADNFQTVLSECKVSTLFPVPVHRT